MSKQTFWYTVGIVGVIVVGWTALTQPASYIRDMRDENTRLQKQVDNCPVTSYDNT